MTIGKLVVGTIVSQILFVITKVAFFHYLNMDNLVVHYLFYIATIIVTIAIVRRMGIINYLESFLIMVVWLVVSLLVDITITSTLIGREMYGHMYYWLGMLFMLLAVLLFHKAFHVEVRKANANKK